MKNLTFIILLFSLYSAVSAQDVSGNRKKVIDMLLSSSHTKVYADTHSSGIYSIAAKAEAPVGFRTLNAIPRYCLAKGAVICRFEEYVQLHSPIKLNIGLGGE